MLVQHQTTVWTPCSSPKHGNGNSLQCDVVSKLFAIVKLKLIKMGGFIITFDNNSRSGSRSGSVSVYHVFRCQARVCHCHFALPCQRSFNIPRSPRSPTWAVAVQCQIIIAYVAYFNVDYNCITGAHDGRAPIAGTATSWTAICQETRCDASPACLNSRRARFFLVFGEAGNTTFQEIKAQRAQHSNLVRGANQWDH